MPLDDATIKSTINNDLPDNQSRLIGAGTLRSVLIALINWIRDSVIEKTNISVVGLMNNEIVSHNLNSDRVTVEFYSNGTRKEYDIDWQPMSVNSIRVFLPVLDNNSENTFTGDVFVMKRA